MKRVYVLLVSTHIDEQFYVYEVFSSKEKAEERAKVLSEVNCITSNFEFQIKEFEVK